MQLRWTEEAAHDLERIADYLLIHVPDRASELIRVVYEAPATLLTFPNRGRPGKRDGTRELVLTPLPYIVVYTVFGDVVFVVRIFAWRAAVAVADVTSDQFGSISLTAVLRMASASSTITLMRWIFMRRHDVGEVRIRDASATVTELIFHQGTRQERGRRR